MSKLRAIFLVIPSILFWSCGSTPKTEEKVVSDNSTSSCYGSYTDKDSVFLKLTITGDRVVGDLTYKLYEKDRNRGTFEGVLQGDTIFASYQFQSEGKTSTREVAFLKKENQLVEGFAPMDSTGTHFMSKRDLDFAGIVLMPDECHE
jgi:hypothetical protein